MRSMTLRGLAAMFLVSAFTFFPLIMNPLIFRFFDAESDAARLTHVEEHLGALRLLFTGIGVTEAALGVALWSWGRRVAERTPGRRGIVARRFGWVALVAGCVALPIRLAVWIDDTQAMASNELSAGDIVFVLAVGGGFSLAFLAFGYLMIRGAMPTWLGVVWMLCSVMFWFGILPLWFFVAALVFGIRGVIRFRPGSTALDRISAARSNRPAQEAAPKVELAR